MVAAGLLQVGVNTSKRIAQARVVKIELREPAIAQIDGEVWLSLCARRRWIVACEARWALVWSRFVCTGSCILLTRVARQLLYGTVGALGGQRETRTCFLIKKISALATSLQPLKLEPGIIEISAGKSQTFLARRASLNKGL